MKKIIATISILMCMCSAMFAKQYVESIAVNRFVDFGFLSYTSDADKCKKIIQEYIDKGYKIISASYDYEQGMLLLVYEDDK